MWSLWSAVTGILARTNTDHEINLMQKKKEAIDKQVLRDDKKDIASLKDDLLTGLALGEKITIGDDGKGQNSYLSRKNTVKLERYD
ncbi:hypothetical protein MKZ38_008117 [Zalerion maritima]|uniref:Uncharacterized protein n=1 Tax=Zalerion maritima TaxID=339359 RepID=A0AAD5RL98_9PEZI|nr:hypothetical protein MKZ38_008117 [Zalerion maritima]